MDSAKSVVACDISILSFHRRGWTGNGSQPGLKLSVFERGAKASCKQ